MSNIINFNDMIHKELSNIDFVTMYYDIYDKNIYNPELLKNALLLTIYHLEIIQRLSPEISSLLTYYISTLNNIDAKISKFELLYIVNKLNELNQPIKKNSSDNLYI